MRFYPRSRGKGLNKWMDDIIKLEFKKDYFGYYIENSYRKEKIKVRKPVQCCALVLTRMIVTVTKLIRI